MDARHTLGEPRILISRSALRHNVSVLRSVIAPQTRICAIVKADAYGHSAAIVTRTLNGEGDGESADSSDAYSQSSPELQDRASDHPSDAPIHGQNGLSDLADSHRPLVDAFAVASIDEAGELPPTRLPIIIFRPTENTFLGRQRSRIEYAIRRGWILTLCSAAAADDVARVALSSGRQANVQIMIDTGMSRSGVELGAAQQLVARIHSHASLRLWGICSHFCCSEQMDHPSVAAQFDLFKQQIDPIRKSAQTSLPHPVFHMANSGAIFHFPASHLDMVRPGIALYGIDPACKPTMSHKLRPVLRWTAPLVAVREIKAGTTVGYGQTWAAPRDTRIGLLPVGYADGYLRAFSSRAQVMLGRRPAPVAGRVSMDMLTIDLSNHPNARIGDEVTLLDDDPLSPCSAYRLAGLADTIPYELFCRIGARIHRVAVEEHQPAVVS